MHRKVLYASYSWHLALDELTFLGLKLLFSLNVLFLPRLLDLIHLFGQNKALVPVRIQLISQAFFLGPLFEKFLDSFFYLLIFCLQLIKFRWTAFCWLPLLLNLLDVCDGLRNCYDRLLFSKVVFSDSFLDNLIDYDCENAIGFIMLQFLLELLLHCQFKLTLVIVVFLLFLSCRFRIFLAVWMHVIRNLCILLSFALRFLRERALLRGLGEGLGHFSEIDTGFVFI